MLSEEEWADVGSLLYHAPEKALSTYNEMTDFGETNPNALAHHRAAFLGRLARPATVRSEVLRRNSAPVVGHPNGSLAQPNIPSCMDWPT